MTDEIRSETSPREVSGLSAMTLYFCFFVSGVAGLIYEVLWAKYLALYVGSTGLAQIIVLATFMGGLALGSQVLGALADRVRHPLKMYAFLELGIGVYALLFDNTFVLGRDVFIAIVRASGLTPGGLIGAKIASCVLSILLPTFLMGGTLPAMSRYMVRTLNVVGPRVSRLYFLNSLGAVFGCLLAGFYLIANYGLQFSMVFGGALSILSGIVALVVLVGERRAAAAARWSPAMDPQRAEPIPAWATFVVFVAVGVSGAVSMMYEVGWIRLLTLVLGSSTYSFSLMLAAFILGLAIGSFLLSFWKRTTGHVLIFGLSELGVGLTVLLMLPFYVKLPYWFNQLASSLKREPATFGLYQVCTFFICALVMIVPTILQGITLPAAIKVLAPDIRRLGHRIGYAYAINTVGTLIGSVGAGFLGLPVLGIRGMLELAVGLNTVLGVAVLFVERRAPWRRWALAGAVLVSLATWGWYSVNMGSWNPEMLSAGYYRVRERLTNFNELQKQASKDHAVYYKDGVAATILVKDIPAEPVPERLLIINGKGDASTLVDMPTQKMLGHLPMIIHPRPEKVLIVGVGSGMTIGSVLAYEGVKQVDVVEISRDVIEASHLFDAVNGRYWEDPRVHVYCEDAKTFLQIADKKYDLIISEPTNPWIAGIAGVFSREFFETCQRHLAPGGLFTQWVQSYELEDAMFFMILETFTSVFPCYTLWNPTATDTILVGSSRPYGPDFKRMDARVKQPGVHRNLEPMGLSSMLSILSFQMADCASRPSHVDWVGAIHSDFFPFLEYAAPRGFFVGTDAKGIRLLDRRSRSPINAKLWVQDYLKDVKVGSDQLRECFQYSYSHQCLFAFATPAWAREWARRYPSDPKAGVALLDTAQPTFEADLQRVRVKGGATMDFASGKSRCGFEFRDYTAGRNYLAPGAASSLLDEIQALMKKFPEIIDPQMSRWRGCLEYDLGMYPQSVSNLTTAVAFFEAAHGAVSDRVDAGLELCESLLAVGDRRRAMAVCDGPLAPFRGDLRVPLMRSRIRDGFDFGR